MTPLKNVRYSAMVPRGGWPPMVQVFVYYDGKCFRNEDTKQVEEPLSFEPRTEADAAAHAFYERWNQAIRAGA